MSNGDTVIGHKHNFDHTTYVKSGSMLIELLNVTKIGAFGEVEEAEVEKSFTINSQDDINFVLIKKGKFHKLTALEDGTSYHCIYSHRYPQALSIGNPGQMPELPTTKRDADNTLWVRVNEDIIQVTSEWADAYS